NGWQRNALLAASLISSVCAYGTKETSVTLIIFLCMTLYVSAGGVKKLFQKSYLIFIVLSCALWILYLYLNVLMHGDLAQSAGQSSSLSHATALLRAPIIFAHMIVDVTPFLNQITATVLSIGVVVGIYLLLRFHGKISGVIIGLLWVCIGLVPTIFLPSMHWWDSLASRYTYLPRVGLATAVGSLLTVLIRDERVARLAKPFVILLIAVVFIQFAQMIYTVTTTYSRVYATGIALETSARMIKSEHASIVIMEPNRPFEENQAHIFGVMNVVSGIDMSNVIFTDSKNNTKELHISNGTAVLRWVPAAYSYVLILPDKEIKIQTRLSKW
ncbi:MAG: hypothetical protein NT003_00050, partial [Candidatus Magasanikbacteria bacterium]|nr:hypothetical protein [Candidatus Magasanikbacteria bacterium]